MKPRISRTKGHLSKRTAFVREIVKEVSGYVWNFYFLYQINGPEIIHLHLSSCTASQDPCELRKTQILRSSPNLVLAKSQRTTNCRRPKPILFLHFPPHTLTSFRKKEQRANPINPPPSSLAPYERRVIELLRNSKDKRARKLAKKRVRLLLPPLFHTPAAPLPTLLTTTSFGAKKSPMPYHSE